MHTNQQQSVESHILFFDDFTADALDRSHWNVEVTGPVFNRELQAYIDSLETIKLEPGEAHGANGMLVIQPHYHPDGYITPQDQRFDFTSGRINTRGKMEFTYGRISARIAIPAGAGLWPAFWVLGMGEWPQCGEIDIMENVGEPDWASVALHGPGYSGEAGLVNKKYFTAPQDVTSWHIYSVEWSSKDSLLFFIDDELVFRVTRPMISFHGAWVYDSQKFLIVNFALGGTYPFKTNGVQTPYYGLPETTVQAIARQEVRLLVDWVKVEAITC